MPRSRSLKERHSEELLKLKASTRLVVMGAAGVGKSSLISQFLYDKFNERYRETVEDLYHEEFEVNGGTVHLEVLDTSGSFSFPAMRKLSIASGNVFILVYGINNKNSFDEVVRLRNQILEQKKDQNPAIVIVGNKADLENDRQIEKDDVELLSYQWNIEHFETSAKNKTNIDRAFKEVLKRAKLPTHLMTSILTRQQSLPCDILKSKGKSSPMKEACIIS
ncbi:ras-related protein Rap-2a-like [Saccoglossus kowalevskii]|uniref:GTP-binding protein Rhes-like n=1 Tax=Saccoglossus kowalevskii TaxID=10224 RepID=A0ABM0GL01_SACKO|nr:PREDICTED: GTP-binding protein Rhes-like [Saccoglossus kowalevskii]